MTSVNRQSLEQAIELRAECVDIIVPLIKDRFSSLTDDEGVFTLMTWFDPQFWQDTVKNGREEIKKLIEIFKTPLEAAGFDKSKVFTEWKSLQSTVNSFYANLSVTDVWAKLFQHRQKEFPNILLLVELIMCISSSNSSVERVFNVLTTLLTDRRLSMSRETMEDCMLIAGNSSVWTECERWQLRNI